MGRVVHFEVTAENPERAAKFYTDVFGWQINKWDGAQPYWLATTGAEGSMGINGGIMQRQHPAQSTINSIEVPSVDDFLAKVSANGGNAVSQKMAIPGMGYMAYCTDTEGNTFGLWQVDPSAK